MIFIKIIAAAAIISAAGMAGLLGAQSYALRTRQLQSLQNRLQLLDTEVLYAATPLPAALQKIGRSGEPATGRIFLAAGEILAAGEGITAAEAWQRALVKEAGKTALAREELALLGDFGNGLGFSDREEQHKKITLTALQLSRVEQLARAERERCERIWRYGGFLVGLSLVLLLL